MSTVSPWDTATHPYDARDGAGRPRKGLEDYTAALKRRAWVVLLCTLLIGGGGTVFTLYQKPVYWANSRILIEPPQAIVHGLNEDGRQNSSMFANFFSTRVQMITSREIAERVLNNLKLSDWDELNGVEDPVGELLGWIKVKPVQNSNLVDVGIEGSDPQLVAKIVNSTVDEFIRYEQDSLREFNQLGRSRIESELQALTGELNSKLQVLNDFHRQHENFLMNGGSVEAARLEILEQAKAEAELRLDKAKRDVERFQALRASGIPWYTETTMQKIEDLRAQIREVDEKLDYNANVIQPKRFESEASTRKLRELRSHLEEQLEKVGAEDAEFELKRLKQEVEFAQMDLEHLEELAQQQRNAVLAQQDDLNKLEQLRAEHGRVAELRDFMQKKRGEIEVGQGLVAPRIQTIDRADPPRVPIRPIKPIQIPLFIVGGLVFGCMLVVGLEFANNKIREPEHLRACLNWPLLGVVPKLDRRLLTAADGKLLAASESPGSQLCEAFRNLRTGILGAEGEEGLRTLLVASAKEGEGASIVAANLAATCARAGESVLLVDLNLRKPTIDNYFQVGSPEVGLTQVLEGHVDFEHALRETRIPNLTVLTTGDVAGVPLDILGTVEMYELLNDLSEKFDRVILDGPGLLGLADSRVVGRFSDGVLLVVRSSVHDSRPLFRVRQLFEHEGLRAVGVVFNCLRASHADLATYASYVHRRPAPASAPAEKSESVSSVNAA